MSDESDIERVVRSRVGTTLRGKYRLDAVLGIGGMAAVYKATHRNNAELAVKMLHPSLSMRESVRQRFLREGYAANSVKHPGAVLVVDDDVGEDGSAFLVMELMRGADVETLWTRADKRLPIPAVLEIALQLLDVLIAAHANGIVHRDIKPANLFVTTTGSVKVLDFGIARARDLANDSGAATGTGLVLGTPAFMSPEQALAKSSDIDAQTDVWATGASMFTLLTGRMVHDGENSQEVLVRTATTPPPSLRRVAPELPASVVDVVDRALAFHKAARWASAKAMRDALVEVSLQVRGTAGSTAATLALLEGASSRDGARAAVAERVDPGLAYAGTERSGLPGPMRGAQGSSASVSRPVSSEVGARSAAVTRKRGLVFLAVAAVFVGAIGTFATVSRKTPAAASASALAVSGGPSPSAAPPLAAPASAAVASASAPSNVDVTLAGGEPSASGRTAPPPPAVRPAKTPAAPGHVAAAPPATKTPATSAVPSAKPKCRTERWVDDSGETHLKEVCE